MNELISIIIPVYNEGPNISKSIQETELALHKPHEYLIIYDFEKDNTIPFVKKMMNKKIAIKLLPNDFGHGVTNAVKTGFSHASGTIIVVMTPDGADDPRVINEMYKKLSKGFDIVCATRYSKGGKRLKQNSLKSFLSQLVGISTPFI